MISTSVLAFADLGRSSLACLSRLGPLTMTAQACRGLTRRSQRVRSSYVELILLVRLRSRHSVPSQVIGSKADGALCVDYCSNKQLSMNSTLNFCLMQ